MEDKVVKRGYVKWTDENGVFHKEPLADHPDLLANASPAEQLHAEEARRLNEAATLPTEEDAQKEAQEKLDALKAAPAEVHTAAELDDSAPASGAEEHE